MSIIFTDMIKTSFCYIFQVIPFWNQLGVKTNLTTITENKTVLSLMVDAAGYGMMLDATWIICILCVSMVSLSLHIDILCKLTLNSQLTAPLSCGSPDSLTNTTIVGKNYTVGNRIEYNCPKGHSLIGDAKRSCDKTGLWSGKAPTCKCKYCYFS